MSLFKKDRLHGSKAAQTAPRPSVMVVDDEDGNLQVLHTMLADRFNVLQARDGREALDLLEAMPPDEAPIIILSDQRMPRMTGIELFERVRELMPRVIRIIITGFVDVNAIVDAINRAGIYKFVVKPFDRNDLLLTITRALEAFEMRHQLDQYVEQLEDKVRERTLELEDNHRALQLAYAKIEQASLTDPLTGLGNRRFLLRQLDGSRCADPPPTPHRRSALLLLDIDYFKWVNDTHGHAAGDAVLTGLADVLRAHCRAGDIAVRWGGEEFLLQVQADDEAQAMKLAAQIRQAVAEHAFRCDDETVLRRTCSIGIALLPADPALATRLPWSRVLKLADQALYMAKRTGRNACVALSCQSPLPDDFESRLSDSPESLVEAGVLTVLRESGATATVG